MLARIPKASKQRNICGVKLQVAQVAEIISV